MRETTQVNGGELAVVDYEYDELGRLSGRMLGTVEEQSEYDIRSWLTAKSSELFDMSLGHSYTGNITSWQWQHKGDPSGDGPQNRYEFTYDDLSRLTHTDQYVNGERVRQNVERHLSYDRNGNLLSMIRYENGEEQCNMKYQYQGNHLYRYMEDELVDVDFGADTVTMLPSVLRFESLKPWLALHEYDANGNVTKDRERGLDMSYNCLNLLEYASDNDANAINYCYLADGTKLSATTGDDCGFSYRGSFTYRTDESSQPDRVFESTPFGGGRIVGTVDDETEVRYFLTDHLGSVRAVVNSGCEVLERNDYQPFGKRWVTPSMPVSDNRDRFNGKEDQSFAGLPFSDYGARMYDYERGRWLMQDPKAENFINSSQYCFCGNNPISRIDINGEDWYSYQKKEYNEQGEMIEYTAYAFTEATSQQELDDAGINGTYLGAVVVIFAGSLNEKLGTKESDPDGLYINGDGAITAQVTVYGPKGESDIARYTGFTMSSDFKKYGAIADGEYTVNYLVPGKSAPLPSNYAVNGGNPVDCLNGINPSPISPYSATQKNGIYIHATNINGKAGGNIAASTGCLLIQGGAQWNRFQSQIGKRDFKLILHRQ